LCFFYHCFLDSKPPETRLFAVIDHVFCQSLSWFFKKSVPESSLERKQFVKIVNILGDKVETVTPFLVKGMINNQQNGKAIRWLTTFKAFGKFFMSLFRKRRLIE